MNHSVLLFPEGRKNNLKIGEAKPGIVFLAKRTGALVVPVKISGTVNMNLISVLLRRRKIVITFGTPIPHSSFLIDSATPPEQQYKKYAQEIMCRIEAL